MPDAIARVIAVALLIVHAGLGVWAAVGCIELIAPAVPWTRLSNPLFSRSMLLVQWALIGTAAIVFIAGYFTRWRYTPPAMLAIYAAMATVCAYQTFYVLTHPGRYRAMAIEYVEYALVLLFLFFSDHMRLRFGR